MNCYRKLFSPEALFFLLALLGLQWKFQSRAFNDPGAFWHVRVGERILDDGFMSTDPFTYTFAGQTWIPQQWGGEVAMALAHRISGFDGMLLGMSAMIAGLFTWIFSRMIRNGMHPALAGLLSGFALVVCAFHFYARPHLFTLVGMGVTMVAIVDFERGRASLWRLWWLIPFNILWTNIHGGVLGGVLTLGLAVGGWMVWQMWRHFVPLTPSPSPAEGEGGKRTFREYALLIAIVAACGLTPFVNPFGMEMLNTWKRIVGSEAMKELVSEHQPLTLENTAGQVVVYFALFYLFAMLGTLPKRPRISWLLPLVWFALSFKGIRQGPLFAVVGAIAFADLWPHTVWHRLLTKYGDSLARNPEEKSRSWGWMIPSTLIVFIAIALQVLNINVPLLGKNWAKLDVNSLPVELKDDLVEYARTQPAGTQLFNDANLGGFLLYHAPGLKIFMDDRFELYGDPWIRDYVDVVYDHPERFEAWAEKYHFSGALLGIPNDGDRLPLEKSLSESPRWVVVSRCERGVLFRRADPPPNPAP